MRQFIKKFKDAKKFKEAIKGYGEFSERCLNDVGFGGQIVRKYYETHHVS